MAEIFLKLSYTEVSNFMLKCRSQLQHKHVHYDTAHPLSPLTCASELWLFGINMINGGASFEKMYYYYHISLLLLLCGSEGVKEVCLCTSTY